MTDILQPDNERHSHLDKIVRRRNEVIYAFHNISILGHAEHEEPKKHPMHRLVATGENYTSTPSEANHKPYVTNTPSVAHHEPSTTSTQYVRVEERSMPPKLVNMAQVEPRPTNNQTPLGSSWEGFNESSTEERERLARQAAIQQELNDIYKDKPGDE